MSYVVMDIESAFCILTGESFERNKGTTKAQVRQLCGDDWDESAWTRMTHFSNKAKKSIIGSVPFYDKEKKLWFWY